MSHTNKILLAALLLCFSLFSFAQTDSPYSRYGYGILSDNGVGVSKSMGGLSYGLRNKSNINPGNPASYSKIDSLTFLFEIGITYNKAKLSDDSNTESKDNGGLDYITMMMPLSKKMAFSFGIMPYSSMGYHFTKKHTVSGVITQDQFSGSGGFSQLYGGLGYEPFQGLSVGANVSYLFGKLSHQRSSPLTTEESYNPRYQNTSLSLSTVKIDLGVQYEKELSKNQTLVLGAVYSPAIKSKGNYEIADNIYNTQKGVYEIIQKNSYAGIDAGQPAAYGIGFTYAKKDKLLFGVDATLQQWSKINYGIGDKDKIDDGLADNERFNDRIKVNAGMEYVNNPMERSYFKRIKFRGGVNYSNSYLNVKNSDGKVGGYNQYGVTVGAGLPFRDHNFTGRTSYINVSLEYKNVAPEISNMVKEQYFGVSVSVNINDLWFMKSKFR